jgi:predicted nucleic acid-binding protein
MNKTNRFVIDTNTLISAFLLSSSSIAAQAYYKIKVQGDIVISEAIFEEFLMYLYARNLINIYP